MGPDTAQVPCDFLLSQFPLQRPVAINLVLISWLSASDFITDKAESALRTSTSRSGWTSSFADGHCDSLLCALSEWHAGTRERFPKFIMKNGQKSMRTKKKKNSSKKHTVLHAFSLSMTAWRGQLGSWFNPHPVSANTSQQAQRIKSHRVRTKVPLETFTASSKHKHLVMRHSGIPTSHCHHPFHQVAPPSLSYLGDQCTSSIHTPHRPVNGEMFSIESRSLKWEFCNVAWNLKVYKLFL